MAAKIEQAFPEVQVELIRGGKGNFIVKVDGKELWNKRQMEDRFPEEAAIVRQLGAVTG